MQRWCLPYTLTFIMTVLPRELIDYIIDYYLEGEADQKRTLFQLFQVSKAWRTAVGCRLYAFINLEGDYAFQTEMASNSRIVALCRTLRRSLMLATYIKKMSLHFIRHRQLNRNTVELLRLCPTLPHLILNGQVPCSPHQLIDALVKIDLRVLSLNLEPEKGTHTLPSDIEFIRLLQC